MLSDGLALLLVLSLCQANALPLASQLSEEDEKVTKCITEILADTLSKPSPVPVTSKCMKILREDERVLAMLHHQNLLTELEDLAHQENAKHRLGHEDRHDTWEREGEEQEELKKREERPSKQREAAEKMLGREGTWKEEGRGLKEYQKTEKIEEKVKEVSQGEDNREALEKEAAKEETEDEGEEDRSRKKKRTSSETWSSQEYFGHMKNRDSGRPKIREVMVRGSRDGVKRRGSDKRPFEWEGEEEEEDSSEEKPRNRHHGGRHHEDWEDEEEEEEEEEKRRRADLNKRVAEKASDEETAQFEEEEKGVKFSNSKGHLHGGWKPWPEEDKEEEEEEEGKTRYGHHHRPAGQDLRKRHHQEDYPKGKHHSHEEEEGGREASQNEDQELDKLEEIEHDLQKAAEKLRELKRGSPLPSRQGQV